MREPAGVSAGRFCWGSSMAETEAIQRLLEKLYGELPGKLKTRDGLLETLYKTRAYLDVAIERLERAKEERCRSAR